MLSGRSSFKQSAPAPALMDYNAGRPEPRALVLTLAISAASLLALLAPGAALMILCSPPRYGEWGAWAILFFCIGGALSLIGVSGAIWAIWSHHTATSGYEYRQREAFALELELRERQGGVEVVETVSEWEFSASNPRDIVTIVVAMQLAVEAGRSTPWSTRALQDGVWIGSRKLGDVNTNQAREIPRVLEELGLVEGRGERDAGRWVGDREKVFELLVRNGKKVL